MKKCAVIIILISVLTLFSSVTVLTPNGGETWKKGLTYEITWTDDITEDVKIELYQNEMLHSDIIAATASDGAYSWTIPLTTFGDNFKVKVSSTVMPALHSDLSDNVFSIQSGSIQVNSPNGGESFQRGSNMSISWTDDISENVKIELYQNDTFYSTIVSSTASDGNYSYSIPLTLFGNFKIKISSIVSDTINDLSNSEFEIKLGSITVTSPNGGEQLERGASYKITWNSQDISENVGISLYQGTSLLSTIDSSAVNDGDYDLLVPSNVFGSDFRIIISSILFPTVSDESDSYFEIKKGIISISSPAASETLELFTDYEIEWSDDIPENLTISLYKNETLVSSFNVASTGSFIWNFYTNDLIAGNDYKIKLASTLYADVFDETNYFTIKGTNNVSGSVNGTWSELNSPYIFTDSVYVLSANSLFIEPSVKIYGYPYHKNIDVEGRLLAMGNPDNLVRFNNIELNFNNATSTDSSKIQYSIIQQTNKKISTFSKTFGGASNYFGKSVKQTTDGGYIIVGYTDAYNAMLIKTDSSGNQSWIKYFELYYNDYVYGNSVQQTTDGGYIFTGSFGDGVYNSLYLLKTDTNGNQSWVNTYAGGDKDSGYSVQQTTDGGYIISGYTNATKATYTWLIKTESNGDLKWKKILGSNNGYSVQQTTDGGFIIAGNTTSTDAWGDVSLIKTDSNGIETWRKTFGGSGTTDTGYSVQQTNNGGYIIAGTTSSYGAGSTDVWLIKTDNNGNEDWNKTFGGTDYDSGSSVVQTSDGGFLITGTTKSYGAGFNDVWLVKTDSNGNEAWNKTFGGSSNDAGNSVQQVTDGGYIITGSTSSYSSASEAYLIKTDEFGSTLSKKAFSINNNSKITLQNSIVQNYSDFGIDINNALPIISNNLIVNNGNGVKLNNSSPQYFINNTICANDSCGIFFSGNSNAQLINNIVYGNGIYEAYLSSDDSDPIFYYNDIKGGRDGFGLNTGVTYNGSYANNIDLDPLFDSGDNYTLTGGSPCIDAGYPGLTSDFLNALYIPQTDLAGNSRLYYSQIDIGCYESQASDIESDNSVCEFALYQNYPNPFNPNTSIRYSLANNGLVNLKIFDITGREVATLINKTEAKGLHQMNFIADNLTSGIYFYRLTVDDRVVANKKMMLLK